MVFEGSMVSRCVEGGPVYMPDWMKYPDNRKYQDIKGDGLSGGGQGASGMSALGGTIRLGELVKDVISCSFPIYIPLDFFKSKGILSIV
jgi:hypothetical protein